ncbi:hypothetical protein AAVH_03604 [Aphelenchoides avenae]|nr:hypothetical protein AAVH_03604 [Aphelenchus avenae]
MNPHLVYESLFFANRDTLDACMLASRGLKDMISRPKPFDMLRPISVSVNECNGAFHFSIYREPGREYRQSFSRSYVPESEWPELMPRIDNCYVQKLNTCWSCSKFLGFMANFVERATGTVKFRIDKLTHESVSRCRRRNEDPGEHFAHQVAEVLQVAKFKLQENPYLDSDRGPLEHPSILSSIEELELNEFQKASDSRNMVPLLTVHALVETRAGDLWEHIPEVCERSVKAPVPPGPTQRLFDLWWYLSYDEERPMSELFTFRSISSGKQLQVFIWRVTVDEFPSIVYHCVIH